MPGWVIKIGRSAGWKRISSSAAACYRRSPTGSLLKTSAATRATPISCAVWHYSRSQVIDNNGPTVPGATVTIVNPANSFQQTATTNDDGIFTAPQLPPGNYTVNVVKEGFKTTQKTDVILSTSDKLSLGDIVLEVGDVA